jgi:cytoskeleton protein RodZ
MDEVENGQETSIGTPPRAGEALRAAREAQGLTLADVAGRTRVPQRHLEAIEAADYHSLPSPTYAVGFAKAYARAVGADEVAIARDVRAEVDRLGRRTPEYVPYETADPARVPTRGVAIMALGLALALLVIAGVWYGTDWFRPAASTGAPAESAPAAIVASTAAPLPTPSATPQGQQVTLTATDEVWLRVYDADNKTLYMGTLQPGERFDVPAGANEPMINVGRPDKLTVTLNGSAMPPLGTGERPIKDVRVSAAALGARASGAPEPQATVPSAAVRAAAAPTRRADAPAEPRLSETQRANLDSANGLPADNGSQP